MMSKPAASSHLGLEAIARPSLHEELLDRLRTMIIEGALAPATRIPERELCERFQVSRTPLREALKVLAAERLVELTPNRGATVASLSVAELEETFPVMAALEALSGELAATRITSAEIATVTALHERIVGHYRNGDLKAYFHDNEAIHAAILAAARNDTLAAAHATLAGRVRRSRFSAPMSPARWAQAIDEHEQILAAIAARRGKRLAAILRKHVDHKSQVVRDAMADGKS